MVVFLIICLINFVILNLFCDQFSLVVGLLSFREVPECNITLYNARVRPLSVTELSNRGEEEEEEAGE